MWYNRIMAYNVKYNWLTFLNSLWKNWWLMIKEFSFFEVATQSTTEKYAIQHWEYVNPTQMKNRRIRILFDIVASNEKERRDILKRVQRAFIPEANPTPFNDRLLVIFISIFFIPSFYKNIIWLYYRNYHTFSSSRQFFIQSFNLTYIIIWNKSIESIS